MSKKPYRKNVGVVVFNKSGKLLVGEREQFPGAWQFPQGGIDEGEDPREAVLRELYEETGVKPNEIVYEYPNWISYDFPSDLKLNGKMNQFRGQTQKWFLVFWEGNSDDCKLDLHEIEFVRVEFMSWDEILEKIVKFKKDIYSQIRIEFEPEVKSYLEKFNS
jgi:putative (di)nucleoside polyphosphate hydrolase